MKAAPTPAEPTWKTAGLIAGDAVSGFRALPATGLPEPLGDVAPLGWLGGLRGASKDLCSKLRGLSASVGRFRDR